MFRLLLLFSLIMFSFPSPSKAQAADPALCPEGYTCPDTSFKPVFGEVIDKQKDSYNGVVPDFSGKTGPRLNELYFPDYTQEEGLFLDKEIIKSTLPYELIKQDYPIFENADLKGFVGHSGCDNVVVNNQRTETGAKVNQDLEESDRFTATNSLNRLLTGFRFWQSLYVEGKGSSLKYRTNQPIGVPDVPQNRSNCNQRDGESYNEAPKIGNPEAPDAIGFLAGVGGLIEDIFKNALKTLGLGIVVPVEIKVQQEKYLPGETAFMEESHDFLNSFIPYEETGTPIDQEEQNSYWIFGEGSTKGVNFLGAKSTQEKTVNLVKSLRPYEEAKLITTLGPTGGLPEVKPPTPGLNYTIPYNNPDAVRLTPETKNKIIEMVKNSWPNTKIAEQWDIVASTSYASGINPAFAIALWIEESGASHYNNHFSCPPSESDFQKSFNCFINTTNNIQPPDWARWVRNYCGTPENQPICKNDSNGNFIDGLESWYKKIVPPGSPGAATPL